MERHVRLRSTERPQVADQADQNRSKSVLYPGSTHLFADPSLDDYDEQMAGLLTERTLAFLTQVG